jgi:hypothetical protein
MSAETHPKFMGRLIDGTAVFEFSNPSVLEQYNSEQAEHNGQADHIPLPPEPPPDDTTASKVKKRRPKPKPPKQPVQPVALDTALAVFKKWLHMDDTAPVLVAAATVVANLADGDPVWLLIVGPPPAAKPKSCHPAWTWTTSCPRRPSPKRRCCPAHRNVNAPPTRPAACYAKSAASASCSPKTSRPC